LSRSATLSLVSASARSTAASLPSSTKQEEMFGNAEIAGRKKGALASARPTASARVDETSVAIEASPMPKSTNCETAPLFKHWGGDGYRKFLFGEDGRRNQAEHWLARPSSYASRSGGGAS